MNRKKQVFRGVRKGAHISRKVFSKAANFSGRVENKTDRILHGRDTTVQIHDRVSFEKIYIESLPEITPIYPSLPLAARGACVTLLIPSLQKSSFFGGTATALTVAGSIAIRKKVSLRIVETLQHGNSTAYQLRSFLESVNIGWEHEEVSLINLSGRTHAHYGYLDIHPDDIFIASAWWDAHLLQQLPLKKKFIYLIQDFEPIFYNNSDRYVLAERTYQSDKFVALCNTKLMYDFMINRNYNAIEKGTWFEPAVGRQKSVKPVTKRGPAVKKRLFLYGRPSVERNLFFTALSAINYCFSERYLEAADWEVCMAGQDKLPDIELTSGVIVKNLGKLNIEEYVDLLQTVNVAVSPMMAPHPNYPTLEFASTGAQVVTTRYDIKQDLSKYAESIIMADITTESIAGAIKEASMRLKQETPKSQAKINVSESWVDSLDQPIDFILDQLAR